MPVASKACRCWISEAAVASSPVNNSMNARALRATGSSLSAPTLRASSTCRSESTCQLWSSHRCRATMPATECKGSASSTDMSVPKVWSALRSIGNPAAYPLIFCATRPSSRRSRVCAGCAGGGRAPDLQQTLTEGKSTGKVARRQGLQVGPTRKLWVDRLEPAGGLQQHERGLTVPIREERELSPNQLDAGLLKVAQRPSPGDSQQVPRLAECARPDFG